jgi:hypothetical protein
MAAEIMIGGDVIDFAAARHARDLARFHKVLSEITGIPVSWFEAAAAAAGYKTPPDVIRRAYTTPRLPAVDRPPGKETTP